MPTSCTRTGVRGERLGCERLRYRWDVGMIIWLIYRACRPHLFSPRGHRYLHAFESADLRLQENGLLIAARADGGRPLRLQMVGGVDRPEALIEFGRFGLTWTGSFCLASPSLVKTSASPRHKPSVPFRAGLCRRSSGASRGKRRPAAGRSSCRAGCRAPRRCERASIRSRYAG